MRRFQESLGHSVGLRHKKYSPPLCVGTCVCIDFWHEHTTNPGPISAARAATEAPTYLSMPSIRLRSRPKTFSVRRACSWNVLRSQKSQLGFYEVPEGTIQEHTHTHTHTCGVFFTNCCFHPSTQPPHSPTNVYALHKTAISAKLHQCITKLHRARKETHYVGYMTKLYQLTTRTI